MSQSQRREGKEGMKILPKDRTIKRTGLVMGRFQMDVGEPGYNCMPNLNGIPLDNIVRVMTDFHALARACYISVYYYDDNNDNHDPEKMIRRRIFVTDHGKLDLDLTGEVFPEEDKEYRCFPTAEKMGTIEKQCAARWGYGVMDGLDAVMRGIAEAFKVLVEAAADAAKLMASTLATYDLQITRAMQIDSRILKARREGIDPQSQRVARQGRRQLAFHRQARRTP